MYTLEKSKLTDLLNVWDKDHQLLCPARSGNDVILTDYEQDKFTLDYINFSLPPKEFLFEMKEKLYDWKKKQDGSFEIKAPEYNRETKILFGIRACDAYAIAYMDKFFTENFVDANYIARREATYVVALNCETPGEGCFCTSTDTGPFASRGADLIFTPIDDKYLVEAGTGKGNKLIDAARNLFMKAEQGMLDRKAELLEKVKSSFNTEIDLRDVKDLLERNYDNPIWDQFTAKCVECNGCTFVCPTCVCFNVTEKAEDNEGSRHRCWDSCQSSFFTRNAGDHNTRNETSKFRYRIYDKLKYISDKFGMNGCVGCGRCMATCLGHISFIDIVNALREYEQKNPVTETKETKPETVHSSTQNKENDHDCSCSIYIPQVAVIKEIHNETDDIKRFIVQYEDKSLHQNYKYHGQFFEITVFGVGEIPISIPWAPSNKEYFEFVIKKVGKVTTAIHNMKAGDKIGLRGPFGRGFPMKEMEGSDVLFIGSGVGLAPVRTAILYALENKEKFGKIVVISRAMTYDGMIYKEDVAKWKEIDNVDVYYALAKPTDKVEGYYGKLDQLFGELDLDWKNTKAVACGSPKRIKLIAKDLVNLGMDSRNIFTTLETHMRCGVGKCGHCKVGSKYMCLDGPVFSYEEMLELPPEY